MENNTETIRNYVPFDAGFHEDTLIWMADGTEKANKRLQRVLTTDPGTGVMRHVDAGYSKARKIAKERNLNVGIVEGL